MKASRFIKVLSTAALLLSLTSGQAAIAKTEETPKTPDAVKGAAENLQVETSGLATAAKTDLKNSKKQTLAAGEKININTASKQDLMRLPTIGEKKAQAIIDGRPYKTADELAKVKGIKQGVITKIKNNITL